MVGKCRRQWPRMGSSLVDSRLANRRLSRLCDRLVGGPRVRIHLRKLESLPMATLGQPRRRFDGDWSRDQARYGNSGSPRPSEKAGRTGTSLWLASAPSNLRTVEGGADNPGSACRLGLLDRIPRLCGVETPLLSALPVFEYRRDANNYLCQSVRFGQESPGTLGMLVVAHS